MMHFLPLQLRPIDTAHYLVSGDVTIHEGAAIAPGVLLQAGSGSRIIIGAGVCIGIGSVIHVHEGTLEIGDGAIIGAGVLLIGQVKIGDRACIGSASTILDSSIEVGGLVAPGSLVGDRSRLPEGPKVTDTQPPAAEAPPDPWAEPKAPSLEIPPKEPKPEAQLLQEQAPEPSNGMAASVYGQSYVNSLLIKLFPQNQRNPASDNGHSLNGNS
jgi:carbon dioxide concentrating mechanism protein CcmN